MFSTLLAWVTLLSLMSLSLQRSSHVETLVWNNHTSTGSCTFCHFPPECCVFFPLVLGLNPGLAYTKQVLHYLVTPVDLVSSSGDIWHTFSTISKPGACAQFMYHFITGLDLCKYHQSRYGTFIDTKLFLVLRLYCHSHLYHPPLTTRCFPFLYFCHFENVTEMESYCMIFWKLFFFGGGAELGFELRVLHSTTWATPLALG
jgi:hypothetical protein